MADRERGSFLSSPPLGVCLDKSESDRLAAHFFSEEMNITRHGRPSGVHVCSLGRGKRREREIYAKFKDAFQIVMNDGQFRHCPTTLFPPNPFGMLA